MTSELEKAGGVFAPDNRFPGSSKLHIVLHCIMWQR